MKDRKNSILFRKRMNWIYAIFFMVVILIISNLYSLQIQRGSYFREKAEDQYITSTSHIFERGNIYFENNNRERFVAAGQKKGIKISVNPSNLTREKAREIINFFSNENLLVKNIDIDRLTNQDLRYLEIAQKLPYEKAQELKEKFGKSIQLYSEKWRIYPLKHSAAHILGFLGYDKNNIFGGRYGLERFYNNTLFRSDKNYVNLFARIFHNIKKISEGDFYKEGDIVASINPEVQVFLEKEVSKIQERWSSSGTGGVVINPTNGEIIAMVSAPNFDNNNFKYEELAMFKNPIVSNVYEFGSVIKPLVVAIGIDRGVISDNSTFYDRGFIDVEDYTIYNFDKRGRGWVTTQEILNQSLNTGMVNISKKIKKNDFRDYFAKYGFGEKTGIDLPNDSRGLISNLKSNRDIEFANMSFGQGIAVSPISLAKALTALANQGIVSTPHLVRKIEYTDGLFSIPKYETKQAISEKTASEISRMLVNVFDTYKNGGVKFEHYSIAAKTGTAQISDPKGGYYKDRNLHSFFGYFPAYNPRFLVVLYTVHPKKVKYSSQTLIDPFRNIARYLINEYHIAPDR